MNFDHEAPRRTLSHGICRSPRHARRSHGRRAAPPQASEIKYIVNNTAITTYDIQSAPRS